MPDITVQDPLQIQQPGPGDDLLKQLLQIAEGQGFGVNEDAPQTNPLVDELLGILSVENNRIVARQNPEQGAFFGDIKRAASRVGKDIFENIGQEFRSLDPRLFVDAFTKTHQFANNKVAEVDTESALDIIQDTAAAGFLRGLTFGLDNLPLVGNFIDITLEPIQAALDVQAAQTVQSQMQAFDSNAGRLLSVTAPAMAGGLTGGLIGTVALFLPFMKLGRLLTAAPAGLRAASVGEAIIPAIRNAGTGFIGDIAGFGIFGAATGERGLFAKTLPGSNDPEIMGERFLEMGTSPDSPWWMRAVASAYNRGLAATMMANEGYFISIVLNATLRGAMMQVPIHRKAAVDALRLSTMGGQAITQSDIVALRQAQILADPGKLRMARIESAEHAMLATEIKAMDEIISRSPKAMELLAEQQGIEGIVSYQTSIAAYARGMHELSTADHATTTVLRRITDPYRLYQDVLSAPSAGVSPVSAQIGRTAPVPLAHAELADDVIFGYVTGSASDESLLSGVRQFGRDRPVHMLMRPNPTAAEFGRVEEVVLLPGKQRTFPDWNTFIEKKGNMSEGLRDLQRQKVTTLVIEKGAGGEREVVILDPTAIQSSKTITPEMIKAPTGQTPAEIMARELANEPIEVALSKRMPEFKFETPIKRDDGTYDIIMHKVGAPSLSGAQLRQFKVTGVFEGQNKFYNGKMYTVVRRLGRKGKGDKILMRDPTTNEEITVAIRNVWDFPSAMLEVPVDDAVYAEFRASLEKHLSKIHDRQLDGNALRNLARESENPGALKRDMVDSETGVILYPDEILTSAQITSGLEERMRALQGRIVQLSEQAQTQRTPELLEELQRSMDEFGQMQRSLQQSVADSQGELLNTFEIDIDKAFVQFPEPLDYFNIIWKRFLQDKNITGPVGELDALKFSVIRKLNQDMFKEMPANLQTEFKAMSKQLVEEFEKLPPTLENFAHQAGYNLIRFRDGSMVLNRPGSLYYEGLYTSEAAVEAALNSSARLGGAPSVIPQNNWLNFGMPSGPGLGAAPNRSYMHDMDFSIGSKSIGYLARVERVSDGFFFQSKPKWALNVEEKLGIPIWTEHLQPLFSQRQVAANQEFSFLKPIHDSYLVREKGVLSNVVMSRDKRIEIGEFISEVPNEAIFKDLDTLMAAAKEAGLNTAQQRVLRQMRKTNDELFTVGMDFYGWGPTDYIYNYYTDMRPVNLRSSPVTHTAGRYRSLPRELDVFASKYRRQGMLAETEMDPLVVQSKYLRTFFHEKHVAPAYDRTRALLDMKIKDLTPATRDAVLARVPANMKGVITEESPALPNSVADPIREVLAYMSGHPNSGRDLIADVSEAIFRGIGMKVDRKVIEQAAGTMQMWHYGATLALRPRPTIRNSTQVVANLYIRTDAAAVSKGFERAQTSEAFLKAIKEGVVPLEARGGVPFAEKGAVELMEDLPIVTTGPLAGLMAGAFRFLAVDGSVARSSRILAEKGLSGITNTDHLTRVWAAETQEAFIQPFLTRFAKGTLDEAALRSKGLVYWDKPIKDKFMRLLTDQNEAAAMKYIRKEASDVINFMYGQGAQPGFSQNLFGRGVYMYGTYGIWWKDLQLRTLRGATSTKDYTAVLAKMALVNGSLALAGLQFGIDMGTWMAHNSILGFGGGPLVSLMDSMRDVMVAPNDRKHLAMKELFRKNVMRTAFPGQLFFEDIQESLDELPYPSRALVSFLLGRPSPDHRSWTLDQLDIDDLLEEGLSEAPPVFQRNVPKPLPR